MLEKYYRHSCGSASRVIDGEAVVVIPREGEVKVLNETGTRIWDMLNGRTKLKDVAKSLADEFDIEPHEAQQDTAEFCRELEAKGMLEVSDEPVMR